jgi:hypothetical protein
MENSGKERIKSEPSQPRLWKCVDILGMCSANLIPLNSDSMQTLNGQSIIIKTIKFIVHGNNRLKCPEPESIELFMEDQAFLLSYDLAPLPSPPPPLP